jgi:hypothetical protein
MAEWWTKISVQLSSGEMKPIPFFASNHLHAPVCRAIGKKETPPRDDPGQWIFPTSRITPRAALAH